MAGKRPINADLPVAGRTEEEPARPEPSAAASSRPPAEKTKQEQSPPPPARRGRQPIPAALKAIAGLVLVALVFLVAAVLGGGGSNESASSTAPAPAPAVPEEAQKETPAAEAAEELGYPAFATNNTTRIGGGDAATTAAGVALAVFPSTTVAQRPLAVTLVDEDEWQGAVAASVLMAAPLRAPLLVTAGGEMPDPTSQALAALDPQGSAASDKAQAFSVGGAASPDDLRTTEVDGDDPAALAVALAKLRERLAGKPAHIVLTSQTEPELAVPAAAWAARSGDPVLFTARDSLPKTTAAQLKRHPNTPVYVLGPSAAVSSEVVRRAGKLAGGVRRVSGEDPVANALAFARYASGEFGWNVNDPGHGFVIARSEMPLTAAIASPLSASGTWGPLLLTDSGDTLPAALRDYLLDVKPGYTTDPTRAFYNHVWVIGDQEAIDVKQQAEINQLAELTRIGGGEP